MVKREREASEEDDGSGRSCPGCMGCLGYQGCSGCSNCQDGEDCSNTPAHHCGKCAPCCQGGCKRHEDQPFWTCNKTSMHAKYPWSRNCNPAKKMNRGRSMKPGEAEGQTRQRSFVTAIQPNYGIQDYNYMQVKEVPQSMVFDFATDKGYTVDKHRDPKKVLIQKKEFNVTITLHKQTGTLQLQIRGDNPPSQRNCLYGKFKSIIEKYEKGGYDDVRRDNVPSDELTETNGNDNSYDWLKSLPDYILESMSSAAKLLRSN